MCRMIRIGDQLIVNGNYIPLARVGTQITDKGGEWKCQYLQLKNQKKNVGKIGDQQPDRHRQQTWNILGDIVSDELGKMVSDDDTCPSDILGIS